MDKPQFPLMPGPRVFIAAPGDVGYLREVAKEELERLKSRVADDHGIQGYSWEDDEDLDPYDPYHAMQQKIPSPSDPNCKAIICIFGERIGVPLPEEPFLEVLGDSPALDGQARYRLVHPWQRSEENSALGPERSFPLTGTVFEYLAAAVSEQKPLLLLFVGDESILDEKKDVLNRNWGLGELRKEKQKELGENLGTFLEWAQEELRPQLTWLNHFLRHLIEDRGWVIDASNIVGSEDEAVAKIREFLQLKLGLKVETALEPFKRLEAYGEMESEIFFGRRGAARRVVDEIARLLEQEDLLPFYTIEGASGAGKSSFLRAGVIARMERRRSQGYFLGRVVRPGDLAAAAEHSGHRDPLIPLFADCLAAIDPETDRPAAAARLAQTGAPHRPARAVESLLQALDRLEVPRGSKRPWRLVLGVDQFEECLDELEQKEQAETWDGMFSFLEKAVESRRIAVVCAIKTSRLGELNRHPLLGALRMRGASYPLGFPKEQIEEIIKKPFQLKNLELEEALVRRMKEQIRDFVDRAPARGHGSVLPLVSATLSRIWEQWRERSRQAGPDGDDAAADDATGQEEPAAELPGKELPAEPESELGFLGAPPPAAGKEAESPGLLTLEEYGEVADLASSIDELGMQTLEELDLATESVEDRDGVLARILRPLVRWSASDSPELGTALLPSDPAVQPLAQALRGKRLIADGDKGRVRLVHEAVLRHWSKAAEWVEKERDRLRVKAALNFKVQSWLEEGRPGERLQNLGRDDLDGAAELLYHWGLDLAPIDPRDPVAVEMSRLRDFATAALMAHPDPGAAVPKSEKGGKHLHAAALVGAADLVRLYLEKEPDCAGLKRTADGRTALFEAAFYDRIEVLELLLDHGAPVNQPDKDGWTALHAAATFGRLASLEALLGHGGDPAAAGPSGTRPLSLAAGKGHRAIVERLLADERVGPGTFSHDKLWSPLHSASAGGHEEVVRLLLGDPRVDPSLPRNDGWTALHLAANNGRGVIVACLLADPRTDPNAPEKSRWTALHFAARNGHEAAVEHLLADARIEPDHAEADGWTALHLAAHNGHDGIVARLLASQQVEPGLTREDGRTALHLAAAAGHGAIVARLLADGRVEPNAGEKDLWTALHFAARGGRDEIAARLLADPRTEPNRRKSDGWTALHLAAFNGHGEIVACLLADPRSEPEPLEQRGWSPLALALEKGHTRLAASLVEAGARLPLWTEADGQDVRRLDGERLRARILADLRADGDPGWPIPPLVPGDWQAVGIEEAAEVLAAIADQLPKGLGMGASAVSGVRKHPLSFYEESYFFEARVLAGGEVAGYLTFVQHPHGLTLLDGTSPPIHRLNAELPVRLGDAARALAYLRFFCSAVQGEEGAFTLFERPEQLLPAAALESEDAAKAAREAVSAEVRAGGDPARPDEDWMLWAVVKYAGSLSESRFRLQRSGMVEMLADEPVAAKLSLHAEKFFGGLRRLVLIESQEPPEFRRDRWSALQLVAAEGDAAAVGDLLAGDLLAAADTPAAGPEGDPRTPLQLAAARGHAAAVARLLAEAGTDPNPRGQNGWTPLHLAAASGHAAVVERLLSDPRVAPEPREKDAWTPLHLAAANRHEAAVARLLADPRVDPNALEKDRWTPLHLAAGKNHAAVVARLLADPRIDPNPLEKDLWTPLHLAAANGKEAAVTQLLADPRVEVAPIERTGLSPVALAARGNHGGIAAQLVAAGAGLPLWCETESGDDGQVTGVRWLSGEPLRERLLADLEAEPAGDWPIPPLVDGEWTAAAPEEAADVLVAARGLLPGGLGAGLSRVDAVRRHRLPFYDQGVLYEARVVGGESCAGYLTLVRHREGTTLLGGTSTPIHEINAKLPVQLDDPERVLAYLRFFCAAVHGDDGAFTLFEDPERLLPTAALRAEDAARAKAEVRPLELAGAAAPGEAWEAAAVVKYSSALFEASFRVERTGMTVMSGDLPIAANLAVRSERFSGGLRCLHPVATAGEPEFRQDLEKVRQVDQEKLHRRLEAGYRTDGDVDWPIPPLLEGAWESVGFEEVMTAFSELAVLPAVLEEGNSLVIDAARKLPVDFYEDGAVYKVRVMQDDACVGYLTLMRHRDGAAFLDGTAAPIHSINQTLLIRLEGPDQVLGYLRLFCAAVQGEEGAFTLFESPQRLLPSAEMDAEEIAKVAALAKPAVLTGGDPLRGWQARAVVKYAGALFESGFLVQRVGTVQMFDDNPLATDLRVRAEIFRDGLRTLHTVETQGEPEAAEGS